MPHGLPSAIKLQRSVQGLRLNVTERQKQTLDEWPRVWVACGELVQPIEPLADQAGWDGHWKCHIPHLKLDLAIPGDELRFSAHL